MRFSGRNDRGPGTERQVTGPWVVILQTISPVRSGTGHGRDLNAPEPIASG
jgi:hypothetical protein